MDFNKSLCFWIGCFICKQIETQKAYEYMSQKNFHVSVALSYLYNPLHMETKNIFMVNSCGTMP